MSESPESPKRSDLDPKADVSEQLKQTQSDETGTKEKELEKRVSDPVLSDRNKDEQTQPKAITSTPEAGTSKDEPKKVELAPHQEQTDEVHEEQLSATPSLKDTLVWTMTSFFDWNPMYLLQMRGICNVLNVVLNLIVIILLSINCQMRFYVNGPSEGFYCQPPETFLFTVSIGAFLTSVLYLFCCLLSKNTDKLLFETAFEVAYFTLYFILILTSSSAVLISAINWSNERTMGGHDYDMTYSAAIIGLVNSIVYGVSAVCYFINQRYYKHSTQNLHTVA